MGVIKQAAAGRRKTWQGHDEEDWELLRTGAEELYAALTGSDRERLETAADYTELAFAAADDAEIYHDEDSLREDSMYRVATECLKGARKAVGMPAYPMNYRGNGWWKAERRGDKMEAMKGLTLEHFADFGFPKDAHRATQVMLEAGESHHRDNWEEAEELLEDFYEIAFPYLTTR